MGKQSKRVPGKQSKNQSNVVSIISGSKPGQLSHGNSTFPSYNAGPVYNQNNNVQNAAEQARRDASELAAKIAQEKTEVEIKGIQSKFGVSRDMSMALRALTQRSMLVMSEERLGIEKSNATEEGSVLLDELIPGAIVMPGKDFSNVGVVS